MLLGCSMERLDHWASVVVREVCMDHALGKASDVVGIYFHVS